MNKFVSSVMSAIVAFLFAITPAVAQNIRSHVILSALFKQIYQCFVIARSDEQRSVSADFKGCMSAHRLIKARTAVVIHSKIIY